MTRSQVTALRRGLAAQDRALLKRLIDAEVRRRHDEELERVAATKERYHAELAARRRVLLADMK